MRLAVLGLPQRHWGRQTRASEPFICIKSTATWQPDFGQYPVEPPGFSRRAWSGGTDLASPVRVHRQAMGMAVGHRAFCRLRNEPWPRAPQHRGHNLSYQQYERLSNSHHSGLRRGADQLDFGDLHAVGAGRVAHGREEHLIVGVRHVVVERDRGLVLGQAWPGRGAAEP